MFCFADLWIKMSNTMKGHENYDLYKNYKTLPIDLNYFLGQLNAGIWFHNFRFWTVSQKLHFSIKLIIHVLLVTKFDYFLYFTIHDFR